MKSIETMDQSELPLVSVFVGCYNHAKFLLNTLDSVRSQTYPKIQLIIWDDKSTDNSPDLIRSWLDDNQIKCEFIQHSINRGLCKTLNEALSIATGKYIAMVAADDLWQPDKLSRHVQIMENQGDHVGVVYSDALLIDENGKFLSGTLIGENFNFDHPPTGSIFNELFEKNFIPAPATLIRRECFEHVGIYDEDLCFEDWDMWLRISRKFEFTFDATPSAMYRVVSTSMVRSTPHKISDSAELFKIKYIYRGWLNADQERDTWMNAMENGRLSPIVAERGKKIETLTTIVSERDAKITALTDLASDLDGRILDLNRTVEECEHCILSLNKKAQDLESIIDSARQWQKQAWLKRALHKWRPPNQRFKKIGIFKRFERSVRKRRNRVFHTTKICPNGSPHTEESNDHIAGEVTKETGRSEIRAPNPNSNGRKFFKLNPAHYEERENKHLLDIDVVSKEIVSLQELNWMGRVPSRKVFRRILASQFLYWLSRSPIFTERKRTKLLQSAEKRDPILISTRFDEFCSNLIGRLSQNHLILTPRPEPLPEMTFTVTAIVPNFNHGAFLQQRIDSILNQTYRNVNILILDDASSDNSRQIIESYLILYPERIRAIFNEDNSGSVFNQWKKGHEAATGDLVWFCESDDFCEPDFLERLLPAFLESSVLLAFGNIQFVDESGFYMPGLDHDRETAEPGIWDQKLVRPSKEWFTRCFGIKNVISNVGGSVWRRFTIQDEAWETAKSFQIMGDWYLYSVISSGGQIAFEPTAFSYFRIHSKNTSGSEAKKKDAYYREYARLMTELKKRWDIPDVTLKRFVENCRNVFSTSETSGLNFDHLVNYETLRLVQPCRIHVLIGFLGFSYGGGEIFPIHLANALTKRGIMVSMLKLWDMDDHEDVQKMLNPGVPVYTADYIRTVGIKDFMRKAGVSIVHSHIASTEMVLLDDGGVSLPYVSTLHGSYEAMNIGENQVSNWAERIDHFVYTADRNLEPFKPFKSVQSKFRKFKNAMPIDETMSSITRSQLGIADQAIVFMLVARGIPDKGWTEAVHAFIQLEGRSPHQDMALLLVGEGDEVENARTIASGNRRVHFLGYQKQIPGLYRIADVALAPTRYSGESFPLCLIQAMQVGKPIISTNIGEIKTMVIADNQSAGIVVPFNSDTDNFIKSISDAMAVMLDPAKRKRFADCASKMGQHYGIDNLCQNYIDLYAEIIEMHALRGHALSDQISEITPE